MAGLLTELWQRATAAQRRWLEALTADERAAFLRDAEARGVVQTLATFGALMAGLDYIRSL